MPDVTILIADDHTLFREGLRSICEIIGGFKVIGEASGGCEAVSLAKELSPDIILMDINMPRLDGVSATREIIKHNRAAKIIILTMFNQDEHLFNAIKAGARGYLLKDATGEKLIEGIHAVYNGFVAMPPGMAVKVMDEFRHVGLANELSADVERLTPGEMDVIKLVARGKDNRTIADTLGISEKTVSNRLSEIFSKLYVKNRTQAALHAIRRGWAGLYSEEGE